VTKESLAAALQQARAAAEVAQREQQRLCDFLRAEVEQRDSDAVRASQESERVGTLLAPFHPARHHNFVHYNHYCLGLPPRSTFPQPGYCTHGIQDGNIW